MGAYDLGELGPAAAISGGLQGLLEAYKTRLGQATEEAKIRQSGFNVAAQAREAQRAHMASEETRRVLMGLKTTPKAPSGFRFVGDGDLEAIPGGPADVKLAQQEEKKSALTNAAVIQSGRIMDKVNQAMGKVSRWSTGWGSLMSAVPGTSAKNLAADLKTIKANIGFGELQAMRQASPTGGALGQVAVQELDALQSTISALDQDQSPAQLKHGLQEVYTHFKNWNEAVRSAEQQRLAPASSSRLGNVLSSALERSKTVAPPPADGGGKYSRWTNEQLQAALGGSQ